ncbi:hypothetical protein Tco_0308452 [Tanacetum coccineum]
MRDFHKNHPSGYGAVMIIPSVISEGTNVKPGVPCVNEENNKSKADLREMMKMDSNNEPDSSDIRLNEPVDTDKGLIQKEGIDAAMTNIQQGNENPEILEVIEDAHVTLSTVSHKTQVPVTSSSHSSDLAAKFLNFSDIPHTDAELVSPMDVYVHHEVPCKQTSSLLKIHVSVISESSPIYSTVIL